MTKKGKKPYYSVYENFTNNVFWILFFERPKRHFFLLFFMFFFNACAATLEGISFAVFLFALTFISGEAHAHPFLGRIQAFLNQETNSDLFFVYFVLAAIVLQICRSLFSYFGQLMTSNLTLKLQKSAQQKIYEKIFRFTFKQLNTFKIGDLINHTSTPPTFFPTIMDSLNRITISCLFMAGYICFMLMLSLPLTGILGLLFAVTLFVQKGVINKIKKSSEIQTTHMVELSKETTQYFNGFRLIHLFSRQTEILKKIESLLSKISHSTFKLNLWNHLVLPINECFGILLAGIILILGFMFLKASSSALLPTLLIFVMMTYRFGTRVQILMQSFGTIATYMGPINRMVKILETKEIQEEVPQKSPLFSKQIHFDSVSFSYPNKKNKTIKSVSFSVSKGKTLALVGASGAGKSTILDLLLRLYEPERGKIFLDGNESTQFDLISWRNLFGVVSQEGFLFHDTIGENIRFGKLNASLEQIQEAARLSGAHEFISNLPKRYHTVVGEKGYRLSGGEKQRISLARALIRDPEILVLDEATSNLDSESEYFVQKALVNLKQTKTIVIVAHRLSTVALADEILVLEKGTIVEKGTHDELLNSNGKYSFWWKIQARITHAVDYE